MAYTVSQNFKDAIKGQTIPKSCLLLFDDLYFSTADITENGVIFNQYFNTSDDLTFGDCPSDTLSFSVISNGYLSGYGFGKCQAYLGVQTAVESYTFGDINAHIEVGGYTWTASETGLYCDDTLIDRGVYVSLISDGTYVYAVGLSSAYRANIDGSSGSSWIPNKFMAQKLRSGISAVFDALTGYVWDGENVTKYEYVPMGEYNVKRPRSTVGDIITIQDAYDSMSLFDVDASEFLASLSYPRTLAQIYTALCNYVGVSYASSTFTYSTTSYSSSPFSDTACTCRDVLSWIAERARRVAHFNRNGVLELRWLGSVEETVTASDISQNGYSIAEYQTQPVSGVLLKSTEGASLSFGYMTNPYTILANPFVGTITNSDLNAYRDIMTYVPLELSVIECDPSIDLGDLINVHPMVEEIVALTDVFNQIYANSDGEAFAIETPTYAIPLMNREVVFNGGIRATYTATGNELREVDSSDNIAYNANVAANVAYTAVDTKLTQQDVFNRLTNNGQMQGIYMDSGDIYINASYIKTGYLEADRIQANSISVSKLTGNIKDSGNTWTIDLDNGTMTLGKLAVGQITGSKSLGNNWSLDFDNGTLTIGNVSANNITAGTITADVTATNLKMTGGSINIDTSSSAYDVMVLNYTVAGVSYKLTLSPSAGISVGSTYSGGSSGTTVTNTGVVVRGTAGGSSTLSPSGLSVYIPSRQTIVYIQPEIVSTW